ncbi:ead/Ea22-like family protein [Escherichia coli]|uniref:ead/Ea22-like family protein n=1 Tax=Escherichia coli TaxID=562 RepID=UPI000908217F|nr:ead/Ea22-like family protein [Escherichia coli]
MTALNKYAALRQLATDAHELGIIKRYTKGIEANKRFIAAANPATVLALLNELEAAESKCRQLAAVVAENAALKAAAKETLAHWAAAEAGEMEMMMDKCMPALRDAYCKTPATDAFLAEVRAGAIPEGYVLVPQQIFLDPSDIESICSQCGDGHESGYGDFTDGLLWVGNIQHDDGSIVHGLHISSADYTEEGGVTVCEFAAQLRKGATL